jgi:WD40 repeat protein
MARIFISHSSANNAEAIALRDWLAGEGWDDVFLDLDPECGIVAGERWERALNEAASRCEAVLFLVSRAWLGSRWCMKELNLAHRLNKRLFGVLIEDVPIAEVPPDLTGTWQLVNLAAGSDHQLFRAVTPNKSEEVHVTFSKDGLKRLKGGLTQAGLDARFFDWPPAHEPKRPPYRGLKPLEAEDAGIFFGREAPIVEALDRLRGLTEATPPHFLVILGASGAGKSSFLRAGLLPRLSRDERNFLPLPILRPDRAALTGDTGFVRSLDAAFLAQNARRTRAEVKAAIDSGAQTLLPLLASLAETARPPSLPDMPKPKPPALILSIDQGEELFLAEGAEEAEKFLSLLKDVATAAAPDVIVLITIRSDSYERLQMAKALEGIKQEAMSLPPVPRGSYADIIEGPARRLKDTPRALKVEPALTQALLTDIEVGGAKDALPLLAFTLERLYVEYGGDGDLQLSEYEQLGRVKGSIEAAVERALAAADADPKIPKDRVTRLALLRRGLIPCLAGIDPDTGIARRRVARLSEIPEEARPLVNLLVDQRLLATDIVTGTGEVTIEPAHEALLRQWGLLQTWLVEDSAALTTLESIKRAARDWETNGKDSSWLIHGGGRLEDAERLRPDLAALLAQPEWTYLAACRTRELEEKQREEQRRKHELEEARKLAKAQKKIARRTGIGLIVASILLVAALGAAWLALNQTRAALHNESISLLTLSRLALDQGQPVAAVRLVLAAWPRKEDGEAWGWSLSFPNLANRPQMRQTIKALNSALLRLHERMSFNGHRGAVTSAVFSQDGGRVVTASKDKTARIWDATTGTVLRELKGHESGVTFATFSPDGRRVVTASKDKTARIWDVTTGTILRELKGHESEVTFATFSPDGGRVVTASKDKTARIWDATTGTTLAKLEGHNDYVSSAAFSPNGALIVTASHDGTAHIWDATRGAVLSELKGHNQFLTYAAFSPDGTRVVTASGDGTARIWDIKENAVVVELPKLSGAIRCAAFSPNGARIVTASDDYTARVWDAATGAALVTLEGHRGPVVTAAFSPDGARVITASNDETARIWEVREGAVLVKLEGHRGDVVTAAFSPDGGHIITSSNDKTARIWDATTGGVVKELDGHGDDVTSVAFSPDGARIALTSFHKIARILDAKTGAVLIKLEGHGDRVTSAEFSPDGNRIVTASWDKTARIWDVMTGAVLATLEGHNDVVSFAAFSPDGDRIVTASWDKTARIWDATTGMVLKEFKGHNDRINSGVFSPDGTRIVTAAWDKTARIWDAATGASLATLEGHDASVSFAVFSPDGGHIITSSNDKTARIWDAATGVVLKELKGHDGAVFFAAFSPDSARIVTASNDKTARIWDISALEKGEAFAVACARLGNNSDLTDVAKRYGLAGLKPICGARVPDKVDWTKVLD